MNLEREGGWDKDLGNIVGDSFLFIRLYSCMCTYITSVFVCVYIYIYIYVGIIFVFIYLGIAFNPFVPNAPFLYLTKTSENLTVFWCFQGAEKWCIGNKWVKNEYLWVFRSYFDYIASHVYIKKEKRSWLLSWIVRLSVISKKSL